jgi:hypothetical protein
LLETIIDFEPLDHAVYIASVPRPNGGAGPMNHRFGTSVELVEDVV